MIRSAPQLNVHEVSKSFESRSITLETASALIDAMLGFAAQARFEAPVAVVDPSGIRARSSAPTARSS